MTEAHPSAEGASGQMIPQTHHLVTINHPQHPHFIVSILHLCDSLFVWCGEAQDGIVAQEEAQDLARRTGAGGTDGSAGEDSRTSKVSEAPLARLSLEERRQLEVDHQMDKELANAMQSAGRQEAEQVASIPKGSLAKEWAVAMIGHSREEGSSSVVSGPALGMRRGQKRPTRCFRALTAMSISFHNAAADGHIYLSYTSRCRTAHVSSSR